MKKIKVITTCLCLLYACFFNSLQIQAQGKTGILIVNVRGNGVSPINKYSYSLYRNDTLVSITPITDLNRFEKKHPVPCRKYTISVFRDDSLFQEYKDINVECDQQIWYTINLQTGSSHEVIENTSVPYYEGKRYYAQEDFAFIHFEYGRHTIEESDFPVRNFFRLATGAQGVKSVTNHFGLGIHFGYDYARTTFKKDTTMRPDLNATRENYTRMGIDLGTFIRIAFYNMNKYSKNGIFLDLGGAYNLPFLFRHIAYYQNHKDVVKRIHNYTDARLFARIGVGLVSLSANYSLFDYVKSPFAQNPKLYFGIHIRFAD